MEETEVETVVRLQAVDIRDLYPELSAEDASSRVCLLCTAKLKDKTHNLTRHLERHHAGALLQLLEQRTQAPPALLASKSRRAQQDKSSAGRSQQQSPQQQPSHESEDTVSWSSKAADAKLALAKWLAQEQLPVDLVEKSGFRDFVEALNDQFDPPERNELRSLLGALLGNPKVHESADASSEIDSKTEAVAATDMGVETGAETEVVLTPNVDMTALRATCRCSQDSPLVSCTRVACGLVGHGEAKVRVLRAGASLFDAQSCRGKVLGKDGVLGRMFVGVVTELQHSSRSYEAHPSAIAAAARSTADLQPAIQLQDRVVGSPYLTCASCCQQDPNAPCSHATCVGISASSGALAQFIVMPVANLHVVPPAVSDDLALLADDISIVLAVAAELRTRQTMKIAIICDGSTGLLAGLLARYLSQDMQVARQDLHVFSTSTAPSSSLSSSSQQYATTTSLDIYQPAAMADVLARQQELAIDGCVDLCGSEASAELAISLVQSMGVVLFVDRARLELHPGVSAAMDMNAVVVRELELLSLHDCREQIPEALRYLAQQAQSAERAAELRQRLAAPVALDGALQQLQTISEEAFESTYLQVITSVSP